MVIAVSGIELENLAWHGGTRLGITVSFVLLLKELAGDVGPL